MVAANRATSVSVVQRAPADKGEDAAPCRHAGAPAQDIIDRVIDLVESLAQHPQVLQRHGLTPEEYVEALPSAIQTLRGRVSASNSSRRRFLAGVFNEMQTRNLLTEFHQPKYGESTVYRLVTAAHGDIAVIQKGCPDGSHSARAWATPEWASETYLWWVCPSMNSHPGAHVTDGVKRVLKKLREEPESRLDGVIFHSELCGAPARPCPKIAHSTTIGGQAVPPPCVYLLPPTRRDGDSSDGSKRAFPALLLQLFGLPPDLSSAFTGTVEPQTGGSKHLKIVSRFGVGRTTTSRS